MDNWICIRRPIALYGLAGNPPHRGHWACVDALVDAGFKVLIVPSFAHAFGKDMAPFETRTRWLREASLDFSASDACLVLPIEQDIAAGKVPGERVYSIEVLDRARAIFGGVVRLAMGPDNADPATFGRFHEAKRIEAEYGLAIVPEVDGVRSTLIRESIGSGGVTPAQLEQWVGRRIAPEVARHFYVEPQARREAKP